MGPPPWGKLTSPARTLSSWPAQSEVGLLPLHSFGLLPSLVLSSDHTLPVSFHLALSPTLLLTLSASSDCVSRVRKQQLQEASMPPPFFLLRPLPFFLLCALLLTVSHECISSSRECQCCGLISRSRCGHDNPHVDTGRLVPVGQKIPICNSQSRWMDE